MIVYKNTENSAMERHLFLVQKLFCSKTLTFLCHPTIIAFVRFLCGVKLTYESICSWFYIKHGAFA